ncbi:MAG TPA: hypothetical protein VE782_07420 [Myxococcaceae bacterium]|nr:hypothetical protein [Myxococcaceae bacterium]
MRVFRERGDFRVTHFSVQGNHVHLLVETSNAISLAAGLKGLAIRLARGLNAMMGSRGPVFADRYHSHALRTPTEVRNALGYVLGNYQSHAWRRGEKLHPGFVDRYASSHPDNCVLVAQACSWLLNAGWRRAIAP